MISYYLQNVHGLQQTPAVTFVKCRPCQESIHTLFEGLTLSLGHYRIAEHKLERNTIFCF